MRKVKKILQTQRALDNTIRSDKRKEGWVAEDEEATMRGSKGLPHGNTSWQKK